MSIELETLESLQNETTAVQVLNVNFERIQDYFDQVLKRNGDSPNYLTSNIDFNNNRGFNVGSPQAATDIARWADVTEANVLQGIVVPSPIGNDGKALIADSGTLVYYDITSLPGLGDMRGTNNLSELSSTSAARANLELGSMAVEDADSYVKPDDAVTWTGGAIFSGAVSYQNTSNPAAPNLTDLGWRSPPVDVVDTNYAFGLTDLGRLKVHTSGTAHAYTINPDGSTAYPNGFRVDVLNTGAGAVTLTRGSGVVLRKLGSSTDANVVLNQHQGVTLIKYGLNTWYALGVSA